MAKGNLFQSMGRGALGDLVFQRVNGEQQTRVRVRHPRNPRTDGQQYQRAIMATVLRAYEAGQAIFSHSFQGNGTTANDQPLFMQRNLELLRKAIANDVDRHLAPNVQAGRVVAPDTNNPVPFAYQISDGNYPQTLFSFGNGSTDYDVTIPRPQANETVSHYCKRVGIHPGDYYTICVFAQSDTDFAYESLDGDPGTSQFRCAFNFARLGVLDYVNDNSHILQTWGDIFELLTDSVYIDLSSRSLTHDNVEGFDIVNLSPNFYPCGSIGVIRSKKNSDLRSRSFMKYLRRTPSSGIYSTRILAIWGRGGEVYPDPSQPLFTSWQDLMNKLVVFRDLTIPEAGFMNYTGIIDSYQNRYILRIMAPNAILYPAGAFQAADTPEQFTGNVSLWPVSVNIAENDQSTCETWDTTNLLLPFVDCSENAPNVSEPLYIDLILDASCVWDAQEHYGSPNYKITNSWGNIICDLYHDDIWPVSQFTEVEVGTALFQ